MNKSDSDVISLALIGAGYTRSTTQQNADIVIFNTCSVRQHAEDRAVARMREASNRRPTRPVVIMAGCLAQHIGTSLLADGVCDIAVGPYQSPELPALIAAYSEDSAQNTFTSVDRTDFADRLHPGLASYAPDSPWHRWVTITHGCENFCTYCIVPFVRGPLLSFPSKKILSFIERLPEQGVIEISLLGQNVNQYGQDSGDIPFYTLLERAATIPGIQKVNFLTSHPKDLDTNIIDVMAAVPTIAHWLHLPLQSGSDRILQRMNRSYTRDHYMDIIHALKKAGQFSITTDLIVGFPGETDEDFHETLAAVREICYDDAYMYAYSAREGTESAEYVDQIPPELKSERLEILIQTQRATACEKLQGYVGMHTGYIAEKVSRKNTDELSGKTMLNHQAVVPGGEEDIGILNTVEITDVRGATLYGTKT